MVPRETTTGNTCKKCVNFFPLAAWRRHCSGEEAGRGSFGNNKKRSRALMKMMRSLSSRVQVEKRECVWFNNYPEGREGANQPRRGDLRETEEVRKRLAFDSSAQRHFSTSSSCERPSLYRFLISFPPLSLSLFLSISPSAARLVISKQSMPRRRRPMFTHLNELKRRRRILADGRMQLFLITYSPSPNITLELPIRLPEKAWPTTAESPRRAAVRFSCSRAASDRLHSFSF